MLRLLAVLALAVVSFAASAAEDFVLRGEGPTFSGKWQMRVFTISSEGSDTWAEPYNGTDSLEIVEAEDGSLTGTMSLYGRTFALMGQVDYGKDRVIVTWSGEDKNDAGEAMHRTFHAYLLPLYANADEQVDMMAGTEGVSIGTSTFGGSGSFVAVRDQF